MYGITSIYSAINFIKSKYGVGEIYKKKPLAQEEEDEEKRKEEEEEKAQNTLL